MGIQMIGIDHKKAQIDVRTIFSFTHKNMGEALERLKGIKGIDGCVMISTCNRMELWVNTNDNFSGTLFEWMCQEKGVDPESYRPYFILRSDKEAAEHLFRLAGGLESRILGEDQIVTQVKDALTFAREHYTADHVLETLFRQAVTAGKKIKTDIVLSSADQSVVHTAVETLKREGIRLAGRRCMVIGNGVMGKLAATLMQQEGADVTVTVRQYKSGHVEIPQGCSRIDYGKRMELFGDCDLVVSATVSPNYTITKQQAEQYKKKDMILIDLAVPRDMETEIRTIPGISLYDIDSFSRQADSETQKAAIAGAEKCIQEQLEEFYVWYQCVDVIPKIQDIKQRVAADMEVRLTKKLREFPLDEREMEELRASIQTAAVRTINKMLFELRGEVSTAAFRECIDGLDVIYKK